MFAVIARSSRIEGKDEDRRVIVDRVTVRTLAEAEKQKVIFDRVPAADGGTRVVTVDGKKLTFDKAGKLVAGGVEEPAEQSGKAAAGSAEKAEEKS